MKLYKPMSLLIYVILMTLFLSGCKSSSTETLGDETANQTAYTTLSAEEAKKIMDSGESFVLVDVRTQEEYDDNHIKGALLIPNETIGSEPIDLLPDKDAKILIYCRSGNRSRQAAEKLVLLGYTQIYDFGGILDWPYETVSE